MMKHAYLILAHDDPRQLERLISALQDSSVCFFIHVDKKSELKPFKYIENSAKNIQFISKRVSVFHRGYKSIDATIALLKAAQASEADYYSLLSGADYPIKSKQQIHDFIAGEKGKEFISFFHLQDRQKWLKKIEHFYYWDSIYTQFNGGIRFISKRARKLQKKFARILPKRKFLAEMEPYGGSQWWTLTNECVSYVIEYIEHNSQFRRFYRFTDVPNELVFQTIILNSPFKQNVMNWNDYSDVKKRADLHATWPCPASVYNFRYIDWTPERQSGSGHPVVFEEQDFELLKSSACLFARKFDSKKSSALLDRIDKELL